MKLAKALGIAVCVYIGLVVLFESLIGFFQPAGDGTLVITTTDAGGETHDRVLSLLESGDKLYVAANHWPRAWYERALENPNVEATIEGTTAAYEAVPVTGEEHERLAVEHDTGIVFRILTGFPPRYFVRLDPRAG